MPESAVQSYTLTARALHWLTAVLVLTMIPVGIAMANADFGAAQDTLYHLHRSIGALLVPIVICRLIYRLGHPTPPLPDDVPAIQKLAANATHWAFTRC
jgi:cytochrome b561